MPADADVLRRDIVAVCQRACISRDLLLVRRGMSVPWRDPTGCGLLRQGTIRDFYSLLTAAHGSPGARAVRQRTSLK